MADLFGTVGRVDRGHGRAGNSHAVENDGVLGNVWRHQPDNRAWSDAAGGKSASERVNRRAQLGKRIRTCTGGIADSDAVRHVTDLAEYVRGDRNVGDFDVRQWAGVDDGHSGKIARRINANLINERDRSTVAFEQECVQPVAQGKSHAAPVATRS